MRSLIRIAQHAIKGCGYLPHCGHHPGTGILIIFITLGALVGVSKGTGVQGALRGAFGMAVFLAPLYLVGAYDRSTLNDHLSKKCATISENRTET